MSDRSRQVGGIEEPPLTGRSAKEPADSCSRSLVPVQHPAPYHRSIGPPGKAKLKEIRLRWSDGIAKDDEQLTVEGVPAHPGGGLWHPDTFDNRRTLEHIMAAGNETYGDGTHWIEQREA